MSVTPSLSTFNSPACLASPDSTVTSCNTPTEPRRPFRFRHRPELDPAPDPKKLAQLPLAEFWNEVERLKLVAEPLSPEVLDVIAARPSREKATQRVNDLTDEGHIAVRRDVGIRPDRGKVAPADLELLAELESYYKAKLLDGWSRLPRLELREKRSARFSILVHPYGKHTSRKNAAKLVKLGCAEGCTYTRGGQMCQNRSAIKLTDDYLSARAHSQDIFTVCQPVACDPRRLSNDKMPARSRRVPESD